MSRSSSSRPSSTGSSPGSPRLADLAKERKKAIEDLDFVRVKALTQEMAKQARDNTQEVLDKAKASLTEQFKEIAESSNTHVDNLLQNRENSMNKFRVASSKSFQTAKQRHLDQLTILEVDRYLRITRARERPSAPFIELSTAAKTLSRSFRPGSVDSGGPDSEDRVMDQAIHLKQEADERKEIEIEERVASLEERFDRELAFLQSRQMRELILLGEALEAELRRVDAGFAAADNLNRHSVTVAVKSAVTTTIEATAAVVRTTAKKSQVAKELTDHAKSEAIAWHIGFVYQKE
jgi:hypothetical protein